MKYIPIFEDVTTIGERFSKRVYIGHKIVSPDILSFDEFERLSFNEQQQYILELKEYGYVYEKNY